MDNTISTYSGGNNPNNTLIGGENSYNSAGTPPKEGGIIGGSSFNSGLEQLNDELGYMSDATYCDRTDGFFSDYGDTKISRV